jgi:hypothetical protein
MLRGLITIVLVAVFASLAVAQERVKEPTEKEIKAAEEAKAREAQAKAALEKQIPSINFAMVSLADAIDQLRDVSGANVFVNWRALEVAGVAKNQSINITLRQVSLRKVLSLLLHESSGEKGAILGWILDDGVIYISTVEDINRRVQIKIYEVRDLLDPRAVEKKGQVLMLMITDAVNPDSWFHRGGNGTIKFIDGKLVITQTYNNHQAIEDLLTHLREFRN